MINLSEAFSLVGDGECIDVASSLCMQGAEPDISIPVYGTFFLKIMFGDGVGFICDQISEFNALRHLSNYCGAVHATLNLCDLDILTLLGITMVATPNTGAHVFIKNVLSDLVDITEDLLEALCDAAGVPFADIAMAPVDAANELLRMLFDKVVDILDNDMVSNGINVHHWEELPEYVNEVYATGEAREMAMVRQQIGAISF